MFLLFLRLPDEILSTYNALKATEQEETCGGKDGWKLKQSLRMQLNSLKNILQLSCYGYNSSEKVFASLTFYNNLYKVVSIYHVSFLI